jgi:hypothetical protein
MVSNAYEYDTSPDDLRRDGILIQEFGEALSSEKDLLEPETAQAVQDLTQMVDFDPQPLRSRMAGIILVGSAMTVVVGGAALLTSGSTMLTVGGAALTVSGAFLWDVYRKTDSHAELVNPEAKRLDALIKSAAKSRTGSQIALMKRMSEFVNSKQALIYRLGGIRPELGWVRRYVPKQPELVLAQQQHRPDFLPQSSPPKAVAAYERSCKLDQNSSEFYTRGWLENKFGRNEIRDLISLGLLKFSSRDGTLNLKDDPVGDYDIIVKNAVAKTATMDLVQSELLKDFDLPAKKLAAKIGLEIGRQWSDSSRQRYGNAFKVWARWIYPHLVDPTKSTYQYNKLEPQGMIGSSGRQILEIHPMKKKQVSELVHQDVSIPAIAEQLGMSTRNVKRAMSDHDKEYRKKNAAYRRKSGEARGKQVQRWKEGFVTLPASEMQRLASLWYSRSHLDEIVLPEFKRAGAPSGFNRGQLYRFLGPRDASKAPAWYDGER